MLCIKLVNYWDKYTEMHGQQNVKKKITKVVTILQNISYVEHNFKEEAYSSYQNTRTCNIG